MWEMILLSEFFLGGSSPAGFKTDFDKLIYDSGCFTYIIKGTAGSGKSTLMKKVSEAFSDEEQEIYRCSADPNSLDAVYLKARKVILVDGTAPHIFEPKYPCAYQTTLDMSEFLDRKALYEKRSEIAAVTDEYSLWHQRCRRYLTALSSITADLEQVGSAALNREKLKGTAERIAKKMLPVKHMTGKTEYKTLSAVTPEGYMLFMPKGYNIYMLDDDFYYGADVFLRYFEKTAVQRGYDVAVSLSYLETPPRYEHMLIPEIKTAFITSSKTECPCDGTVRRISFRRFYGKNETAAKKPRLKFDRSACKELMSEAAGCLAGAKKVHDRLEEFYISAADHAAIDQFSQKLISDIKSMSEQ